MKRQPIFAANPACTALQNAFREAHRYYPFRLAALTILPDHWHGLIGPDDSVVIEHVGAVKKNVLHILESTHSTIWQSRFLDHRIRNMEDFAYHVEYIRLNAIKHEYTTDADTYPWCFIHENPFGVTQSEFP